MAKAIKLLPAMLLALSGSALAEDWVSLDQRDTQTQTAPATSKPIQLAQADSTVAKPSSSAPTGEALQVLYEEIEILKQEVQTLRGLLEEQSHELNKLKGEQKERYIELDRRMSQVIQQGAVATPAATSAAGDEKAQYDAAFQLINAKKFSEALTALKDFLTQHPKSELAVNAYYWTGQIYYIQGQLDDARQAFQVVVNQFPEHQKTADSKLKLGKVYHQLGEEGKAKEMLRMVVDDYSSVSPGTARLAENYLNQHFK